MPEPDPIYRLSQLTGRQREVLQLVCESFNYRSIAEQLYISENTVKSHMGNIYLKLGLDMLDDAQRRQRLHQVICPALGRISSPVEDVDKEERPEEPEEPGPVPENVWLMVVEDERALRHREPITIIPPGKPQTPERRAGRWLRGIIVIVILAAIYGAYWIGTRTTQPAAITNVPVIPPTSEAQMSAAPTEAQAAFRETPTPTITSTPTPESTATPEPSATPTLMPTEPFVPPADGILFSDDFEHGLKPDWVVISGEPFISNGQLSSTSKAWLTVGNNNWKNYRVDLDEQNGGEIYVCVHTEDVGDMYCLHIYMSSTWWHIYKGGDAKEIPNTNVFYFKTSGHVQITVQDNQVTSHVAGHDTGSFWDSNYEAGGVSIYLTDYTGIDNFKVTWLP